MRCLLVHNSTINTFISYYIIITVYKLLKNKHQPKPIILLILIYNSITKAFIEFNYLNYFCFMLNYYIQFYMY